MPRAAIAVFELNAGDDQLQVSDLASFMDTLGHGVKVSELERMLTDLGIDENDDGAITKADFLEFMRRNEVADIPSSMREQIHAAFEAVVHRTASSPAGAAAGAGAEESPQLCPSPSARARPHAGAGDDHDKPGFLHGPHAYQHRPAGDALSKAQTARLLLRLGFVLDELSLEELFDEVDSNADGRISEDELVTCIGMLKRNMLELMHLEESFKQFRPPKLEPAGAEAEQHVVRASDLVAALGVTLEEAEEMIFIADLKDNQVIDFTEFRQVVVNWSE